MSTQPDASAPRRKPAHTARRVAVVLSATAFAGIGTTLAVSHQADAGTASPAPFSADSPGTSGSSVAPARYDGFDPPQADDQFDPFAGQGATPAPFQPTAPPLTSSGGS